LCSLSVNFYNDVQYKTVYLFYIFKVNKVAISGLKNASKKDVLDVANELKMSNLMDSVALSGSLLDDPWIRTVILKKRYPDSYNLILNERETIMKVSSKGKCFFLLHRWGTHTFFM